MVGKNNTLLVEQKRSDKQCRYGIRKLSVGVASVLLGVGFFAGNSVAHADTTDVSNDNKDVDTENSNKIDTSQDVYGTQQISASQTVSTQTENTSAQDNVTSSAAVESTDSSQGASAGSVSQSSVDNSKKESNLEIFSATPVSLQGLSESKISVNDTQQQTYPGVTIPANQDGNEKLVGSGQVKTVALGDGSTLTTQYDRLDSKNQTTILTFKSSSFKAGDTYTIKIPKKGGLDVSATDVASLQPAFGSTSFGQDYNYYYISDKFINSGTISQNIKLSLKIPDTLNIKFGAYTKIDNLINLTKNDNQSASLVIDNITSGLKLYGQSPIIDAGGYIRNVINLANVQQPLIVNNSDVASTFTINLANLTNEFESHNNAIAALSFHINENLASSGLMPESIEYIDPQTKNSVVHEIDDAGNVVLTDTELQSLLANSNVKELTFKLNCHISIDQAKFDDHHKYSFDDFIPDVVTINVADVNSYHYVLKLAFRPYTVIDSVTNALIGELLNFYPSYTAAYTDNNYTIPIARDSVIVNDNIKNDGTISDLSDFASAIFPKGGRITSTNTNYEFKDFVYTLNIPDGLDIRSYNGNASTKVDDYAISVITSSKQLQSNDYVLVTYNDFTSATVMPTTNNSGDLRFVLPNVNKSIKSISVHLHSFKNDALFIEHGIDASTRVKFATAYADGTPVQDGDLLQLTAVVSADGIEPVTKTVHYIRAIDHNQNMLEGISDTVFNKQTNKTAGATQAGFIRYVAAGSNLYGYQPQLECPIVYVSVPKNASISNLDSIYCYENVGSGDVQKIIPKSVSIIDTNSITFIKIDLSNYNKLIKGFQIDVHYDNLSDVQSSSEKSVMLIKADNLNNSKISGLNHYSSDNDIIIKNAVDQLIKRENIDVNYTQYDDSTNHGHGHNLWDILTSDGMTSATMASGNETFTPSMDAIQDDHGQDADQFDIYGSLINATDVTIPTGATQIINLPDVSDGHSQFNPQLTGPVKLVNANTGEDLGGLVDIVYGTELSNLTELNGATVKNPMPADQVTDWSRIKSVMIRFKQPLPQRTSARAVLHLKDPQIYDHVGKTIYVSNVIFANNSTVAPIQPDISTPFMMLSVANTNSDDYHLQPLLIEAGAPASAKLTVEGQSTVTTWVHYKDANGKDQYIQLSDKSKTYNELQDTMKRTDFMQSDSDLTAADRALLPAHFVINWNAQPTIENSTNTYLNGYQNGTADFGKLVKYDFDGDRVVFEGAIEPQVTENKAVKRTIHYKYADGTTAKSDVVQTSKQFTNIGFKNPFTDEITWATNIDSDTLPKVDSPLIAGYRVDKNSVNAITVNVNSNASEETVVYTSDIQHATINYIDDTTGKTLKSDNVSGISDSAIDYQTKNQIDRYVSQHYILVSNDFNDGHESYDHDNNTTQVFNVHLKHDIQTVNDSQTKKLVVHYVYAKDQPKSGQAHTDRSANEIVFTRTGATDLVTNNTAWNAWDNASQTFDAIDSPTIAGYTPDIISVNGVVITPDGQELTEKTVTYKADIQKVVVNYIDDVAKQTLKSDQLTGLSGANVNYTTKNLIDSYRRQGYELVSDDTKGDNLGFDTDANVDQIYNVHLTHHKSDASRQSIVNETINYVFAKDNKQAAPSYHAKAIVFTQTGTKDDVTGEVVWELIDSQSFASVKSPLIAGYTADITEVPAVEVHFGDKDAVKTVTYKANQQKLDVVFIDDVTGQVFKTVTKTGDSDTNSGYSTKADIDGYKANHYDLTSDSTNGKSLVFDHDDTKDQHYEVHLTHHQSDVSRQSTVNEVIHYVYADGNKASDDYVAKPISFTQTGTKDDVADTIVWNKVDSQQFAKIASPVIDGYTPDLFEVSAQTVSFGDQDIVKTVTYHANEQRLKVVFIDDTDNKMLQTINKIGSSDTDSGYNTKADVDGYVTKHYVLVSDDTDGKSLVFDHADDQDQYYEVHLKHGVHNINDVSKVSERIVYQLKDGAKVFGDYLTSVSFTRDGYHDDVTDLDHWNAWQPGDSQVFAKVDSPQKQGYTPDRIQIEAIDVKPGDKDVNKVVIYTPDEQKIVVNYIDDDAKKMLHTDNLTGLSNQISDYMTKPTIDNFISQHYVLVSDDTKAQKLVFDHDDDKDQVYNVHFKHTHQQVTDNSKVNEVVHYVFANGKMAYADFNAQPIEFTRTGSKDLVTNEIIWKNWTSDNQQFNEVISPIIAGYIPSMTIVNAIKVNAGDKDVVQTVTYVPNRQAMVINYTDDVTGKILHTDTLTGVSDQTSDYTTKPTIDNYVSQHYKLVSDDTKGQVLTFDHDDVKTQVYDVHLTHDHSNVSQQSTVNETINYVYQGGVTAADSYKAKPIVFTQTGDKDEVTGEVTWNKVDAQQFTSVKSPVISGFTADITEVPAQTVNFGDNDIVKAVTYKADSQKLAVDFIDDTTGKTLQSVVKYGLSNESSDYNTVSDINKYQGMHYDLVSDSTDQKNLFFDHDDNVDQHYEVRLKHHIDDVTVNKQVTETIHYRYQDGTSAANDKVMAIDFTRKGQHDLVTDTTTWENWTPDKEQFVAVESPEIDGYTPDVKVVDGIVVTADSKDIDKIVTYSKNKVIIPDVPEKTSDGPAVKVETPEVVEKTVFKPVAFNVAQEKDADHRLPQTGNKNSASLVTLGFIGLTTGLGFAMRRRHD